MQQKHIGFYWTGNGCNWLRVWELIDSKKGIYKECGGTVDTVSDRERFKEKFNIDTFYDLTKSSFTYSVHGDKIYERKFNLIK